MASLLPDEARSLLVANRICRQNARQHDDPELATALKSLEHLLEELANQPGGLNLTTLTRLQNETNADRLLFEVRVLRSRLPERQPAAPAVRKGRRYEEYACFSFRALGGIGLTSVAGLAQQSFSAGVPMAAMEGDPAVQRTGQARTPMVWAINEARWPDAEAIFAKVARQQGDHSDGALYWKAYAQNKQGQVKAALETCAELRSEFATSKWVHECGALEIEIHARTGEPVEPKVWSDDDLKLLALASLMSKDEPRALAQLQEILNGDGSEELKKKAMFILGQHYSDATYAQIVRVSYVEGDVRIARGEQNEKPAGEAWEEAVTDLPLETGFSLVTGKGRAEIELEDASTLYLGENSVLSFNDLHTTSGVPYTEVALLSGTLSLAIGAAHLRRRACG